MIARADLIAVLRSVDDDSLVGTLADLYHELERREILLEARCVECGRQGRD